jgi:hypothetical protein
MTMARGTSVLVINNAKIYTLWNINQTCTHEVKQDSHETESLHKRRSGTCVMDSGRSLSVTYLHDTYHGQ